MHATDHSEDQKHWKKIAKKLITKSKVNLITAYESCRLELF
jgi:hypothetical protein